MFLIDAVKTVYAIARDTSVQSHCALLSRSDDDSAFQAALALVLQFAPFRLRTCRAVAPEQVPELVTASDLG